MVPFALGPAADRRTRLGFSLAVGLIVLLAVAKVILFDTLDPDCFWHLRVAEQLRTDGIGPLVDRLSYGSLQTPWTPYSWLAELGMLHIWTLWGWRGAVATQAAMQALFVVFLAASCRARTITPRVHLGPRGPGVTEPGALQSAVATLFGTILALPYLSFRPVTAALVVLSACAWLLTRDRKLAERSLAVWFIVPLTTFAVNLHLYAIFVPLWVLGLLGGAIWEARAADCPADRPETTRRIERYGAMLVLTLAACAITPMLPGAIHVALRYQFSDVMVRGGVISEMQPFYSGVAGRIAAGLVAVFLCCVIFNHRRLRAGDTLLLFLSFLIILRLGRFAPVFAIVAAPIAAAAFPELSDRVIGRPAVCAMMTVVMMLGVARTLTAFPSKMTQMDDWLNRHGPDTPGYPCAAAQFVSAHVTTRTGRLINEFSWGGYLEWRLSDRYQTLLDGRTQLFSPDFWKSTYYGDNSDREQVIQQSAADAAILPTHNSLFHDSLANLGWTTAFRDDRSEVMLPPQPAAPPTEWPSASIIFGE